MIEVRSCTDELLPSPIIVRLCQRIYRLLSIPMSKRVISIAWVSDRAIQRLNRIYRKQNKPTNVLSFVYQHSKEFVEGEIVLCSQAIQKEARELETTAQNYAVRLLVHGLLHLEGYEHVSKKKREKMESVERFILGKLHMNTPPFFS